MRHLKRFSLIILCLFSALMSYAEDITYTYTTNYGTYDGSLQNMFDGSTTTYFWSSEAQTEGKYILITFSGKVNLTSFSTYSSSTTDYPKSCNELQVSSDNTTWTSIGTFQDSQTSTFSDFTNAKGIQYVRIYATSGISNWLYINEITMGYKINEVEMIPDTYSRSDVLTDTWESFCLPLNFNISELQKYFDKIYIPKKGDKYDAVTTEESSAAEIKSLAPRKASANGTTSTITCTAEPYSEEDSYWTDEEEADAVRCCFAYSATGSKYYHFFIADYSNEEDVVIPQGTPFFAHVKSDATLTDNTLTLNGYLWSNETAKTGIIDKEFKVYSDQALTTVDADKSFDALGKLSDDDTFTKTGTMYAINADGTFSATTDGMDVNHAYLLVGANDAEGVFTYPYTESVLKQLTEISVTDPDDDKKLPLTDAEPEIKAGTYKAGNVTYFREIVVTDTDKEHDCYSSFCLPFDFNSKDVSDYIDRIYIPIHVAFFNTSVEKLQIFLISKTGTVEAGTPFIARITDTGLTDGVSFKSIEKVTYDGTESNPGEKDITVFNNSETGLTSVLTSNDDIKLSWGGTLISTKPKDGMNTFNPDGSFGPRTATTNLSAFRAYLIEIITNSSVKSSEIEVSFGEDGTTGIENFKLVDSNRVDVYSINGILVRKQVDAAKALEGLHSGLYIVNGNKVFKE